MIRKLSLILLLALVALVALGLLKKQRARRAAAGARPAAEAVAQSTRAGDALHVHYTLWPPYTAENPVTNRNGYCLDILRRIFPGATFERDDREMAGFVSLFAEEPACATVNFGRHPDLKGLPQSAEPIAFYDVVVLSPRARPWRHTGPESLEGIRLGYSAGYLESPAVAAHWARHKDNPARARLLPRGTGTADWARVALAGEIDAFVATEATGAWSDDWSNLALRDRFRASAPIDRVPLYLTLSGKDPAFAERVLQEFAEGMARLRREGVLERLRRHYGLPEQRPLAAPPAQQ